MHKTILAAVCLAPPALAATTISTTLAPASGIADHTTITLTGQTDEGVLTGFRFAGSNFDQTIDYGFFGAMHQVQSGSTIWPDNNAEHGITNQDTQFLPESTLGAATDGFESTQSLRGAFEKSDGGFGNTFSFAQIVIPYHEQVAYEGFLILRPPGGHPDGFDDELVPVQGNLLGAVPGDADIDGDVDTTDLSILADFFDGQGTWRQGDFNDNGTVDLDDLTILGTHFGTGVPDETSVPFEQALASVNIPGVPEPTFAFTFLVAAARLTSRRRRQ